MSQTGQYLLLVDTAPEHAEEINSLLRNGGIGVQVLFADALPRAKSLITEFSPLLVIFHPSARAQVPIADLAQHINGSHSLLAVRFTPDEASCYLEALQHAVCLGIHAHQDQQLISLVRRLSGMNRSGQQQTDQRGKADELESRFDLLFESIREPVAYLHQGLHIAANTAYKDAIGIPEGESVEGLSLLEIASSDQHDLKSLIRNLAHGAFPDSSLRLTIQPRTGDSFDARLRFEPARMNGEDCEQLLLTALPRPKLAPVTPATEIDTVAAEVDMDLDPLTRVLHRSAFMPRLDQRLLEFGLEQASALYFLEPDGMVESATEHPVSWTDDYLLRLTHQLQEVCSDEDLLTRFGDYSYCVHAARDSKSELKDLAEALCASIEQLAEVSDDKTLPSSGSVGYAQLAGQMRDAEEAVMLARQAWKLAMESGNCVRRYKPALAVDQNADEEAQWVERIRYALANEDFYSVQHTVMNLDGESDRVFENLTWMHEDGTDQPLQSFVVPAERNDLASTIDRQVIPGLLGAISSIGGRHLIQVSGNSVQDFSFANWFRRQLSENDLVGTQVVLQVSADSAQTNLRAARRLIEELSPLGCSFSVSGFKANDKTLALIDQLDLSFVRLHPDLTMDLKHRPEHMDQIQHVVAVAQEAGTMVIAGDVETSADMAQLWQCGVKLVCGEFMQDSPQVIGQ